jgi:hypothetical protein
MFSKDQHIALIADAAYRHTNGEVGRLWRTELWSRVEQTQFANTD